MSLTAQEISVLEEAGFSDDIVADLTVFAAVDHWVKSNAFRENKLGIIAISIGAGWSCIALSQALDLDLWQVGLVCAAVASLFLSFEFVSVLDPEKLVWRRKLIFHARYAARESNRTYSWFFSTLKDVARAADRRGVDESADEAIIAFFKQRRRNTLMVMFIILGAVFVPVLVVIATGIFMS